VRHGSRVAKPDRVIVAFVASALLGLATAASATAAVPDPGDLDPDFANAGTATLNVQRNDYAAGVAIDAQDRIVLAGSTRAAPDGVSGDFVLARYMPSGKLDRSFGSGGIVQTDFNGRDDRAAAVALDSSGHILVAGTSHGSRGGDYCGVARYRPNGELDPTFGNGGKALARVGSQGSRIDAMTIDSRQRVVVGGRVYRPHDLYDYYDFVVARLTQDGALDETFGRGGVASTNFPGTLDEAHSLATDPRGYLVAVGEANSYGETSEFALARYRPGGGLDTSFGDGGQVETSFAHGPYDYPYEAAYAGALYNEGRIIAVGGSSGSDNTFALARYKGDGELDSSFGTDGRVETSFADSAVARGLVTDRLGRLIAVGASLGRSTSEFALARYEPNGGMDPSFGTRGRVTTSFGQGYSEATGVGLDSDGRIVVVGTVSVGGKTDFALARYVGRDKAPPDVHVKGHARFLTHHPRRRAHFRLLASEPAEFRCKLDGRGFHPCSSPHRTRRLAIGRHRLKVQAIDPSGNIGDAQKRFRIVARD
jgi:uncharacterized delta-60 repeat protein